MNIFRYTFREKQGIIASMIIMASFVLIAFMIIIQQVTVLQFQTIVNEISIENRTEIMLESVKDLNSLNERVFNIIIPVVAAWVGAVIAFYFSKDDDKKTKNASDESTPDESFQILKKRFAKGEIDEKEFYKMKKILEEIAEKQEDSDTDDKI